MSCQIVIEKDSWLWLSIILPSILLFVFSGLMEFSVLAFFAGLGLTILWLGILSSRLWRALKYKQPKRILSLLLSFTCSYFLLIPALKAGNYIRLAIFYPKYEAEINKSPGIRHVFDWDAIGFNPSADQILVYDPTDMLVAENKMKAADIKAASTYRDENGKKQVSRQLITRHLIGHFYLVQDWHL